MATSIFMIMDPNVPGNVFCTCCQKSLKSGASHLQSAAHKRLEAAAAKSVNQTTSAVSMTKVPLTQAVSTTTMTAPVIAPKPPIQYTASYADYQKYGALLPSHVIRTTSTTTPNTSENR